MSFTFHLVLQIKYEWCQVSKKNAVYVNSKGNIPKIATIDCGFRILLSPFSYFCSHCLMCTRLMRTLWKQHVVYTCICIHTNACTRTNVHTAFSNRPRGEVHLATLLPDSRARAHCHDTYFLPPPLWTKTTTCSQWYIPPASAALPSF